MKSRIFLALSPLVLLLGPMFTPGVAHAIPAFARQHKTECSTCHTIYPELNEFGDAFLKNGYVWPGKARTGAAQPAKGNEGLWLSGVPEQVPISFTGTLNAVYDKDSPDHDKLSLSARSLRLQAGGSFHDLIGYFATYNLYAQGVQSGTSLTPSNTAPNLAELFALWRHAFGTPVNVKVGRMEPKVSLWKRSDRLIPVPSYASTTYSLGPGFSPFTLDTPEDAAELNAVLGGRVFAAAGVVDRKGQDTKEFYGHVAAKFGGTDFNGKEPELDLEKESVWDYLTVTLAGFGYSGRDADLDANGVGQNGNRFYRAGGEADLIFKRFRLKGSAAFGSDKNPAFAAPPGPEIKTHAYAFEGEYLFGAPVDFATVFRYEFQDDAAGVTRRYIPAVVYAPLQNTRLSLQYNYVVTPLRRDRTTLAALSLSF